MLLADMLSLHLLIFLMFFILVYMWYRELCPVLWEYIISFIFSRQMIATVVLKYKYRI